MSWKEQGKHSKQGEYPETWVDSRATAFSGGDKIANMESPHAELDSAAGDEEVYIFKRERAH